MKVAFDPQIFQIQKVGGISRYFFHLADQFHKRSVDVGILAPGRNNSYIEGLPDQVITHSRMADFIDRLPKKIRRRSVGRKDRAIRGLISEWSPDIVHETYYRSDSYAPGGVPLVLTVYDMIHERFPEMFSPKDATRDFKLAAVNRADHVICISHSTRNDLIHFTGVAEEKVSVVHLGFDKLDVASTMDKPETPETPFLLYVGQRNGYKNFQGFLEAFATSPSLKREFSVVAFGNQSFKKEEMETIKSIGLDPARILHASGSDSILASLYERATAFVYPSLYEGFGLPPLEAMSKSCPAIVSDCSCIPEVLGDAAEYFDPTSTDSIRDALENVVFDEERRQDLIRRGLDHIRKYSWFRCADETLAIYKKLSPAG